MSWDKLTMGQKAEVIRLAVKNNIYDLDTIKAGYNEFAKGGNLYAGTSTDNDLVDWIIKEEGFLSKPKDIGDGKMTIGSGLTAKKWHDLYKKRGNKWSAEDNRRAVAEEVASRRRWAEKNVPNWDTLPESSQKALLSYKYNYDFNSVNSPKLYKALKDSNLFEAARQMDATSKDPKFKKGLQARREREQKWFLSDVSLPKIPYEVKPPVEVPVSTFVANPYVAQSVRTPSFMPEPEESYTASYTPAPVIRETPKVQEERNNLDYFNWMMRFANLDNPLDEFMSVNNYPKYNSIFASGGKIRIKPSHRGRLTELKKRTGKSEAELYNDGNPAHKKMVVFARNARKWKHDLGGPLVDRVMNM